jgi:hypothetical protein
MLSSPTGTTSNVVPAALISAADHVVSKFVLATQNGIPVDDPVQQQAMSPVAIVGIDSDQMVSVSVVGSSSVTTVNSVAEPVAADSGENVTCTVADVAVREDIFTPGIISALQNVISADVPLPTVSTSNPEQQGVVSPVANVDIGSEQMATVSAVGSSTVATVNSVAEPVAADSEEKNILYKIAVVAVDEDICTPRIIPALQNVISADVPLSTVSNSNPEQQGVVSPAAHVDIGSKQMATFSVVASSVVTTVNSDHHRSTPIFTPTRPDTTEATMPVPPRRTTQATPTRPHRRTRRRRRINRNHDTLFLYVYSTQHRLSPFISHHTHDP